MAATVGSISIDLSTNAAKFATGFKSAATTVETQSSRMAKSISGIEKNTARAAGLLKNFGAGLAAGAGFAGLASLTGAFDKLKETISEYDEIATNAKTTGLKSDTYQALAFAAQQANISQESYNSALNIFAKNAGLAAIGQGALYSGLKKLNPELLQNILNTKSQEERLKLVADAMKQTKDATEKAALSAAIFGKGGVEISRILEDGRASIDKFKKTAQDLGIIIPDELLQRAGEIDDKLDVLSKVISVQLGEALIKAAPLLVDMTTKFAELATGINSTAETLTTFVNSPSWATLEKLVIALGGKPFREGSILDQLTKGTAGLATSEKDIAAITAGIDFLTQKIAELQAQAATGADVHVEIDEATQSLNELKARLLEIQGAAANAGKAIGDSFTQSFREAEIASMKALAAFKASVPGVVPTVHRHGGDPNKIELPTRNSTYNSNANDSGVGRLAFGGDPNLKATADYTEDTADNVDRLDTNTKGYISRLSDDIGRYSAQQTQQQNIVINKLSDVTAQTFGLLSQSILAALVHNNDSGATGTGKTMFGDAWDPSVGSFISSWGIRTEQLGGYKLASTADDGSSNTSVQVAQPGSDITLNYYAAQGESQATAEQRARQMWDELNRAKSRQ